MVGHLGSSRCLRVNAGKRKVIMLNGKKGLEYEVNIGGVVPLEYVSEFK